MGTASSPGGAHPKHSTPCHHHHLCGVCLPHHPIHQLCTSCTRHPHLTHTGFLYDIRRPCSAGHRLSMAVWDFLAPQGVGLSQLKRQLQQVDMQVSLERQHTGSWHGELGCKIPASRCSVKECHVWGLELPGHCLPCLNIACRGSAGKGDPTVPHNTFRRQTKE